MAGNRIVRTFNTVLTSSPDKVFPLLCPVREYDWIPQWKCDLIYTKSGYAELGCIFNTDLDGPIGSETWVVCSYEMNRLIGFVRSGTHTAMRYNVSLEPHQDGCVIRWEQEITSLDSKGDMILTGITEDVYRKKMEHLNVLLEHYLVHESPLEEI